MTACPDEELLVGLLEDRLSPADRDPVERHVASCAACLDVVAAALPTPAPRVQAASDDLPLEESSRAGSGRPARRRDGASTRVVRHRLALAACVTLLVTAGLGYGAGRALVRTLEREVARRATRILGVPVSVGRIAVVPGEALATIEMRLGNVRLGDLGDTAGMVVVVPVARLLDGRPVPELIRLLRPSFTFEPEPREDGTRSPGAAARAADWLLAVLGAVPTVEIRDGTLVGRLAGEPPIRIDHVTGRSTRDTDGVRLVATGAVAGGGTELAGRWLAASGNLDLVASATGVTFDALPVLRRWLAGGGDLRVTLAGAPSRLRVTGTIALAPGRLVGRNPLADLASAHALVLPRRLDVASDVTVDALRIAFARRPHRPDRLRLGLAHAGLRLRALARIADDGRLRGSGSLTLPAEGSAMPGAMPAPDQHRRIPFTVGGRTDAPQLLP